MPGNDLAKLFEIEHVSFNELQDARFVLRPARLQSDGCDMFGGRYIVKKRYNVKTGSKRPTPNAQRPTPNEEAWSSPRLPPQSGVTEVGYQQSEALFHFDGGRG